MKSRYFELTGDLENIKQFLKKKEIHVENLNENIQFIKMKTIFTRNGTRWALFNPQTEQFFLLNNSEISIATISNELYGYNITVIACKKPCMVVGARSVTETEGLENLSKESELAVESYDKPIKKLKSASSVEKGVFEKMSNLIKTLEDSRIREQAQLLQQIEDGRARERLEHANVIKMFESNRVKDQMEKIELLKKFEEFQEKNAANQEGLMKQVSMLTKKAASLEASLESAQKALSAQNRTFEYQQNILYINGFDLAPLWKQLETKDDQERREWKESLRACEEIDIDRSPEFIEGLTKFVQNGRNYHLAYELQKENYLKLDQKCYRLQIDEADANYNNYRQLPENELNMLAKLQLKIQTSRYSNLSLVEKDVVRIRHNEYTNYDLKLYDSTKDSEFCNVFADIACKQFININAVDALEAQNMKLWNFMPLLEVSHTPGSFNHYTAYLFSIQLDIEKKKPILKSLYFNSKTRVKPQYIRDCETKVDNFELHDLNKILIADDGLWNQTDLFNCGFHVLQLLEQLLQAHPNDWAKIDALDQSLNTKKWSSQSTLHFRLRMILGLLAFHEKNKAKLNVAKKYPTFNLGQVKKLKIKGNNTLNPISLE